MKIKTRNYLIISLTMVAILIEIIYDLLNHGKLTAGALGMIVLLAGAIIVPSITDLRKEKKNKSKKVLPIKLLFIFL